MRKVRLVPLEDGDEIDLYLLLYRMDQLEKWRARVEAAPQAQLERKEAQAVISNTFIQWLILVIVAVNALTQLAQLFHL